MMSCDEIKSSLIVTGAKRSDCVLTVAARVCLLVCFFRDPKVTLLPVAVDFRSFVYFL